MSQDLVPQQQHAMMPFAQGRALSASANAGAVAIEQERAIAEAQGQLILAKKFPRSMANAMAEFMDACKSYEFATQAFYSVPNRGSGPSIRFMEEAARCYQNFVYGHRELSRSEGKSEIEVYAWDMERNNRSTRQITVMHVLDTKNGPKTLTDQADIDNKIANVASKQIRGRIAALMPKALVAAGIEACKRTLAGDNTESISSRVNKMTQAFATTFGVKADLLAKYLGHTLDEVTLDELTDLIGVFNALKEGAKVADYFGQAEKEEASTKALETITKAGERKKQATEPAATKQDAEKPQTTAQAPAKAAEPAEKQSKSVQSDDKPVKAEASPKQAVSLSQAVEPEESQGGDVF